MTAPDGAYLAPVHLQVERRQHEQREERRRDQAANHDDRQRALDLGAVQAAAPAAAASPRIAVPAVISFGRTRPMLASRTASAQRLARRPAALASA